MQGRYLQRSKDNTIFKNSQIFIKIFNNILAITSVRHFFSLKVLHL